MEPALPTLDDFAPLFLNKSEIEDPYLVIEEFFSADRLSGHQKQLRKWQKFVLADEYYVDIKNNPSGLLFTYKLSIKLIEALYLLYRDSNLHHAFKVNAGYFKPQLAKEKKTWPNFPQHLNKRELVNPYIVMRKFFKVYSIAKCHCLLFEWLEYGLSSYGADDYLYPRSVIDLYQNLLRVYEAGWLFKQRYLKAILKEPTVSIAPTDKISELSQETALNNEFNPRLNLNDLPLLNQLLRGVLEALSSIEMVIHLGTHRDTYYIFIITKEKGCENDLINRIEEKCKSIAPLFLIIAKVPSFAKEIKEGHTFFNNVLKKGAIVYKSKAYSQPETAPDDESLTKIDAVNSWNRWASQSKAFYDGAQEYHKQGNLNLSLFLLHQSIESSLMAIIKVALGYRVTVHNLTRMLKLSLMFTDELKNLFNSEVDNQLLALMQNSYTAARYSERFHSTIDDLDRLLAKVRLFIDVSERLYFNIIGTKNY